MWLLRERDRTQSERLAELKAKIREGIEASERGEVVDGEEFFAELEEDIRRIEAEIIPLEVEPRHADNPWLRFAGAAKDNPYFDEVLAHIEAYRRELDAEMEEYYRKLDSKDLDYTPNG